MRRLVDLASADQLARSREWLVNSPLGELLPRLVAEFIETEKQNAERARGEVAERLAAPQSAKAKEVHSRLLQLRKDVPSSVAPRLNDALRLDDVTVDRALPGFRFKDLLPTEQALRSGGGFGRAEVKLTLLDRALHFECSCGMSPCVHVLAAIEVRCSGCEVRVRAIPRSSRGLPGSARSDGSTRR